MRLDSRFPARLFFVTCRRAIFLLSFLFFVSFETMHNASILFLLVLLRLFDIMVYGLCFGIEEKM